MQKGRSDTSRALVLGAGMGGLLAARVLSGYFREVVVLDRDSLPGEPLVRKGVPQGRHLHTLTTRGSELLEGFFPGLDSRLAKLGAPSLDQGRDMLTVFPEGRLPAFDSGLSLRAVSRALIENQVRNRIAELPNVSFMEQHEATNLLHAKGRVFGVGVGDRSGGDSGEIEADLTVDATGNASRTPRWLQDIGCEPPEEEIVDARLGYATRWYEAPENAEYGSIAVLPDWPGNPRGGTLRIVEDGLMTAVLIGIGDVQPPFGRDAESGFTGYARRMHNPDFYEAIRNAKPVSPVYGYRRTANRRRRYDRIKMPGGFIVTGDAACVLNPSYGQGMTLAAMSAEALEDALSGGSRNFERRFQRLQAKAVAPAWRTTTASDRRWMRNPEERGSLDRYADRISSEVIRTATRDERTARDLLAVKNLVGSPLRLARPSLILPAAIRALKGR